MIAWLRAQSWSEAGTRNAGLLYAVVIVIGLCGHPLAAGATYFLGVDNTPVSALLRALTAGAALLLIIVCLGSRRSRWSNYLLICIGVFWLLYFARLVEATVFSEFPLGHDRLRYWMFAVLGCAVPMFGLALRPTQSEEFDRIFRWVFALLAIAGVMAAFGPLQKEGRLTLIALNPISVGHLGAAVSILSVWWLMYRGVPTALQAILVMLAGMLGLYLMAAGGSRGPLVAFGATLIFLILVSRIRQAAIMVAVAAAIGAIVVLLALLLEGEFGFSAFSRLFAQNHLEDDDVSVRLLLYREALEGILAHPWTGFAIETPSHRVYPHNIILEVFMAVGVIGGGLFLLVVTGLAVKGIVWFRRRPAQAWMVLIFIQTFVGAQFSGALFMVTTFWISVGAMISLTVPGRNGLPSAVDVSAGR